MNPRRHFTLPVLVLGLVSMHKCTAELDTGNSIFSRYLRFYR